MIPDIEKVRELFANDRFATENGMVIDEIGEDFAVCSVTLNDSHRNAMGGVMGGVHFTLADFAFAVASNCKDMRTVGLSTSISYLSPVKGNRLIAKASLVKDGRSTCCYNIEIKDDLDTLAAVVQAVGFHVK